MTDRHYAIRYFAIGLTAICLATPRASLATADNAGAWLSFSLSAALRAGAARTTVGQDVGGVLRFLTKYVRPIGADGRHSLIPGIESFVDLKDTGWGGDSGFAQNRTFVGFGWCLSDSTSVAAGFMNRFI